MTENGIEETDALRRVHEIVSGFDSARPKIKLPETNKRSPKSRQDNKTKPTAVNSRPSVAEPEKILSKLSALV